MKGDCLELMKTIPDGSVDLVLTDPPYRVISGGKPKNKGSLQGCCLRMMEKYLSITT